MGTETYELQQQAASKLRCAWSAQPCPNKDPLKGNLGPWYKAQALEDGVSFACAASAQARACKFFPTQQVRSKHRTSVLYRCWPPAVADQSFESRSNVAKRAVGRLASFMFS